MVLGTDLKTEKVNVKYDIIMTMEELYFMEGVEKREEGCYNSNRTSLCSTYHNDVQISVVVNIKILRG